jgi:hypothetical protein
MRGVREERFKGLVHYHGASIGYEIVKASNLCARTLIFGYFLLLSFVKFFPAPFSLFDLAFYCTFFFFELFFYRPLFSPPFSVLFCTCFFTYVVSSLVYPNLLGNKMVGCCCCMLLDTILLLCSNIFARKTE